MAGLGRRLVNFALGVDEAVNGLGGGKPRETISGTVGRAQGAGLWWAPAAVWIIEIQPWFGPGHCARQAAIEAERRRLEAA